MNGVSRKLALLLCGMFSIASYADASPLKRFSIVALPADLPGSIDELDKQLNRLALTMMPGSGVVFINAQTQERISKVVLPDDPKFENQNVRLRSIMPAFAAVHKFVKDAAANAASQGVPSRISVPATLDEIGKSLMMEADDIEVLMLGSARFHDDREPQFSMRDSAWPGDGMIAASEDKSPYGTATRHGLLNNVKVHFCITESAQDWKSTQVQAHVQRAWTLHVSELGGQMSTYTHDTATCFDRFLQGNFVPMQTYALDKQDTGLTMYCVDDGQITSSNSKPERTIDPAATGTNRPSGNLSPPDPQSSSILPSGPVLGSVSERTAPPAHNLASPETTPESAETSGVEAQTAPKGATELSPKQSIKSESEVISKPSKLPHVGQAGEDVTRPVSTAAPVAPKAPVNKGVIPSQSKVRPCVPVHSELNDRASKKLKAIAHRDDHFEVNTRLEPQDYYAYADDYDPNYGSPVEENQFNYSPIPYPNEIAPRQNAIGTTSPLGKEPKTELCK